MAGGLFWINSDDDCTVPWLHGVTIKALEWNELVSFVRVFVSVQRTVSTTTTLSTSKKWTVKCMLPLQTLTTAWVHHTASLQPQQPIVLYRWTAVYLRSLMPLMTVVLCWTALSFRSQWRGYHRLPTDSRRLVPFARGSLQAYVILSNICRFTLGTASLSVQQWQSLSNWPLALLLLLYFRRGHYR